MRKKEESVLLSSLCCLHMSSVMRLNRAYSDFLIKPIQSIVFPLSFVYARYIGLYAIYQIHTTTLSQWNKTKRSFLNPFVI